MKSSFPSSFAREKLSYISCFISWTVSPVPSTFVSA